VLPATALARQDVLCVVGRAALLAGALLVLITAF
jgi:hypothetical protein